MAKTNPIKTRKHAPYRKSFLIPLWVLQLSLSLTILILSGMSLGYYAFDAEDADGDPEWQALWFGFDFLEWLAADIVYCVLNLFLISSVIFVIIKFSTYTLSTELFKIQSIVAVVLSGICTVTSSATEDLFSAIFSGIMWLASIAICVRVCMLRKRVKRGGMAEMKRRAKELDGEEVQLEDGNTEVEGEGVTLEDGNKFRGVEREGMELEDGNKFRGVKSEVVGMAIMSVAHHVPRPL